MPSKRPGTDPLRLAGLVLLRLATDDVRFGRPDDYYADVVEAELGAILATPGFRLSDVGRRGAAELVAALREAIRIRAQIRFGRGREAVAKLPSVFAKVVEASLTVAIGTRFSMPPGLVTALEAAVAGRLDTTLSSVLSMFRATTLQQPLSPAALDAIECACAVASDGADLSKASCIVPVPWSRAWLFELNGGTAVFDGRDYELTLDGAVGYNADTWGLLANGAGRGYRQTSGAWDVLRTRQADGAVDGWYTLSLGGSCRVDIRAAAGAARYETSRRVSVTSLFRDLRETSTMVRGVLTPGLRVQPGPAFAAGLWAGAGVQWERYDRSDVRTISDQSYQGEARPQLLVSARSRVRWHFLPGFLAARVDVDALHFRIRRETWSLVVAPGSIDESKAVRDSSQTELRSRLFLDVEALRLGGFVPGVHAGVDHIRTTGTGEQTLVSTAPVFGAGVRQESF